MNTHPLSKTTCQNDGITFMLCNIPVAIDCLYKYKVYTSKVNITNIKFVQIVSCEVRFDTFMYAYFRAVR